MPLIPLDLPPGVFRNGTAYQSRGRWFASRLVRWFERALGPFGGWRHVDAAATMPGPGRGMLCWKPASYSRSAVLGSPSKLKVWDGDALIDITPAGFPAGVTDSFQGPGYGFGLYGVGPYGVSTGAAGFTATTWSFDTWGDFVNGVASHSGVVYEYDNDGAPAQPVANAPLARAGLFVTAERALVLLGVSGDMRRAVWSDFEDNTQYTPSPSNAAGDFRFQTDGMLVTGRRLLRGGNLILTTVDAWRMNFIGGVLIYQFEPIASGCGAVGPLAVQTIENGAVWMGHQNFFAYDGVQVKPISCELRDYVFNDINLVQAAKFHCGRIDSFGEVLFFYCSAGSNTINRCVLYNYREGHWSIVDPDGAMPRGCWADVGAFRFPMAVGEDGKLYEHESGWTANGTPILSGRYAEAGPTEAGEGDRVVCVKQVVPDEATFGQMQFRLYGRFTPNGTVTTSGPYPVTQPYVDVRATARQFGIRLEALADDNFRFGRQRMNATLGGER